MQKLKNCPFCGGKAKYIVESARPSHQYHNMMIWYFYIGCEYCGMRTPRLFADHCTMNEDGEIEITTDGRADAILAWNTRTDDEMEGQMQIEDFPEVMP